jgi:glutamate carboxypeptidase
MIETSIFSADDLLAELIDWVSIESPTYEAAAVNRMQSFIAPRIGGLGFTVERPAGRDGFGDILRCRRAGPGDGAGLLLIAHADTVHPVGTLHGKLNVRREGDKCFGPAIYDMKGGTVIALAALKAVIDAGALKLPVTIIINPDEEIGSPTSRELIEAEAKRHKYVLLPEPAKGPRGEVTTGRHAFQRFFLTTHGRPAHSGWTNKDGRSAVRVMAQLVEELESKSDFDNGPTYAVSVFHGGQWVNCVPMTCTAQALCVARDMATFAEIGRVMDGLVGTRSDVRIEIVR